MREARGDMFDKKPRSALVISTNGFVKTNGECVMGRGCALDASRNYPDLPYLLGQRIKEYGNHVHVFPQLKDGEVIVSFPVKPIDRVMQSSRDAERYVVKHMRNKFKGLPMPRVPGWACVADIDIILRSALELVELTNDNQWEDVVCPQFGCGAGELAWAKVKPLLDPILDDRFICMSF